MSVAAFLIIGNEILSGRTQDKNLSYLAEALGTCNIRLGEARIIRDEETAIVETLTHLSNTYTYVFTSGGIGPTHDDITSASVAKTFNVTLERNPEAVAMLQSHYTPEDLNEARLTMADIPHGATLIENPISKAPGFHLNNVYVLAGVPRIFQAMVDGILPSLKGGPALYSETVSALCTEGAIAGDLGILQQQFPAVEIGSYPYFKDGQFGVSLVLRSADQDALAAATAQAQDLVKQHSP